MRYLRIINGKVDGGSGSIFEPLERGPGGAIYWRGNNGTIIASSVYDNEFHSVGYGGSGAIYWEGANGTIRDTLFFNNTGYNENVGFVPKYKFLEGVVHARIDATTTQLVDDIRKFCTFLPELIYGKKTLDLTNNGKYEYPIQKENDRRLISLLGQLSGSPL